VGWGGLGEATIPAGGEGLPSLGVADRWGCHGCGSGVAGLPRDGQGGETARLPACPPVRLSARLGAGWRGPTPSSPP
jgi:hypothetical protein